MASSVHGGYIPAASREVSTKQQKPQMLKDLLIQDQINKISFPRKIRFNNIFFIRAAKYFPFTSAYKSPSILPRSISRRLSRRKNEAKATAIQSVTVTMKDILRWKSFRDLAAENEDFTATTATTTSSSGTPMSSWCDSDFTASDSPLWCGDEFPCENVKKDLPRDGVTGDSEPAPTRILSGDREEQISQDGEIEEDQYNPVSVLDFSLREDGLYSPYHHALASLQNIQVTFENLVELEGRPLANGSLALEEEEADEVVERAFRLVSLVKETSSIERCDANVDNLLLDFFMDEILAGNRLNDNCFYAGKLMIAKAWVEGEDNESLERTIIGTREGSIRDMEKRVRWSNFEEERKEVAIEIETNVLNHLLNELVINLCHRNRPINTLWYGD